MTLLWRPIRRSAGLAGSRVSCTGSCRAPLETSSPADPRTTGPGPAVSVAWNRKVASLYLQRRAGGRRTAIYAGDPTRSPGGDPVIRPRHVSRLNQVCSSQKGSLRSRSSTEDPLDAFATPDDAELTAISLSPCVAARRTLFRSNR
jgi:hypothetical protein